MKKCRSSLCSINTYLKLAAIIENHIANNFLSIVRTGKSNKPVLSKGGKKKYYPTIILTMRFTTMKQFPFF